MEEILKTVENEISKIEIEIRKGILVSNPSVKRFRKAKIETILQSLSVYEDDPQTRKEDVDTIWHYKKQLETYLENFYNE